MTDLYTKEILRLIATRNFCDRLDAPHLTVHKHSRICGSTITVDVCLENGVITAFGQEVKACALGQASAAIVADGALGLTAETFAPIATSFEAMVTKGTPLAVDETWNRLNLLQMVKDHPSRRGSVMLPFEALRTVFGL